MTIKGDTLENLEALAELDDRVIHYIAPMACGGAERAEATRRYNIARKGT